MLADIARHLLAPSGRAVRDLVVLAVRPVEFAERTIRFDDRASLLRALRFFLGAVALTGAGLVVCGWLDWPLAANASELTWLGVFVAYGVFVRFGLWLLRTPGVRLGHVYHVYFYTYALTLCGAMAVWVLGALAATVILASGAGALGPLDCNARDVVFACCLEQRIDGLILMAGRPWEAGSPLIRGVYWGAVALTIGMFAWSSLCFAAIMRRLAGVARWRSIVASVLAVGQYFVVMFALLMTVILTLYWDEATQCAALLNR